MRECSIHSSEIISAAQLHHQQLCTDLQVIHARKISVYSFFLSFFLFFFFFLHLIPQAFVASTAESLQNKHVSRWHSHHRDILLFAVCALRAGNLCWSSPSQKQVTQSGTSVGLILKDCLLSICPLSAQGSCMSHSCFATHPNV